MNLATLCNIPSSHFTNTNSRIRGSLGSAASSRNPPISSISKEGKRSDNSLRLGHALIESSRRQGKSPPCVVLSSSDGAVESASNC